MNNTNNLQIDSRIDTSRTSANVSAQDNDPTSGRYRLPVRNAGNVSQVSIQANRNRIQRVEPTIRGRSHESVSSPSLAKKAAVLTFVTGLALGVTKGDLPVVREAVDVAGSVGNTVQEIWDIESPKPEGVIDPSVYNEMFDERPDVPQQTPPSQQQP